MKPLPSPPQKRKKTQAQSLLKCEPKVGLFVLFCFVFQILDCPWSRAWCLGLSGSSVLDRVTISLFIVLSGASFENGSALSYMNVTFVYFPINSVSIGTAPALA